MPKGPPVHQIFNQPMSGQDAPFHYNKKETKVQTQLIAKKTLAPLPPMKKFGGYKPKILAGSDSFVPISSQQPEAPVETTRRPAPVLTTPKPFIIGDKNTPMILGTMGDDDDDSLDNSNDLRNRMEDVHIYEEPVFTHNGEYFVEENNNINNKLLSNDQVLSNNNHHVNNRDDNFSYIRSQSTNSNSNNEAFIVTNESDNLIDRTNITIQDPTTFASENPVFSNIDTEDSRIGTETEPESESESVFIPPPDYEEDERTMDFDEEDPDDSLEEQKVMQQRNQQRQQNLQQPQQKQQQQQQQRNGMMRLSSYDGEDFAKYLSDDDDEEIYNQNVNNRTIPARLNQKHSLFKTNPHNTTGKRNKSSKNKAPVFNSVRNFSLADSKYTTLGKAKGKKQSGHANDYESFLTTNQNGEGGYETFLRSKHGMNVDAPTTGHTDYRHSSQMNGKQGDGIWKKLTVRLKHRIQKNGYDMKDERF